MRLMDYENQICEELEGAENYATLYVVHRQDHPRWSSAFGTMAREELNHAETLLKIGKEYYDSLSWKNEEMEESWEKCHRKYAEKVALIESMLSK